MKSQRLDKRLVELNFCQSREVAYQLIEKKAVLVNGFVAEKPSQIVRSSDNIKILNTAWDLKGAQKLRIFFNSVNLNIEGSQWLDLGSSSGGFVKVLLEKKVSKVIAVDVGKNLLSYDLRLDPRVTVLEGVNARFLTLSDIGSYPDGATVDLSFISLNLIFPVLKNILREGADLVALIKPQFEAGKKDVSRSKGVIKDPLIWERVLYEATVSAKNSGFQIQSIVPVKLERIKNCEFFGYFKKSDEPTSADLNRLIKVAIQKAGTN